MKRRKLNGQKYPTDLKKNFGLKEPSLSSKMSAKELNPPCLPICMSQRAFHVQLCSRTF